MKVLAVDTSSRCGALGLTQDGEVLAEVALKSQENHSARLLPSIDWVLQRLQLSLDDIDAFGVVTGPGSFTGLRVGLATIKGFAWSLKKPVVGISSLEVLARGHGETSLTVIPMLDARRGKVYAAGYQISSSNFEIVLPEQDISIPELLETYPKPFVCLGDGARYFQKELREQAASRVHFAESAFDLPRGGVLAKLAHAKVQVQDFLDVESAQPNYMRQSEAEVRLKESS